MNRSVFNKCEKAISKYNYMSKLNTRKITNKTKRNWQLKIYEIIKQEIHFFFGRKHVNSVDFQLFFKIHDMFHKTINQGLLPLKQLVFLMSSQTQSLVWNYPKDTGRKEQLRRRNSSPGSHRYCFTKQHAQRQEICVKKTVAAKKVPNRHIKPPTFVDV